MTNRKCQKVNQSDNIWYKSIKFNLIHFSWKSIKLGEQLLSLIQIVLIAIWGPKLELCGLDQTDSLTGNNLFGICHNQTDFFLVAAKSSIDAKNSQSGLSFSAKVFTNYTTRLTFFLVANPKQTKKKVSLSKKSVWQISGWRLTAYCLVLVGFGAGVCIL